MTERMTDGAFYVIQLAPDVAPNRVKLGWALDPAKRLRQHRCSAPTAQLVSSWPAHRQWETPAIAAIASTCTRLSHEAFDSDDLNALVRRAGAFFAANQVQRPLRLRSDRPAYPTRLRAIRERKVLTQQELAEKAGITRATLSRLESGAENPYPSTIRKLATALGVEPQALMARAIEPEAPTPLTRPGAWQTSGKEQACNDEHSAETESPGSVR